MTRTAETIFPLTITFSDGTRLQRREIDQDGSFLFVDYVSDGADGPARSAHFVVADDNWALWTPDFLAEQIRRAEVFDTNARHGQPSVWRS